MATYLYSDPHFDSENVLKFCNRPFKDVDEMNRKLIQNYNTVVLRQDICIWLGDVMYAASKTKVSNILRQMHGRKYLILGNHDRGHSERWWLDAGFDKVFSTPLYDAQRFLLLSHEPLPEFGNSLPIVNFHGHIHTQDYDFTPHNACINVCVEATDYKPVLMRNPFIQNIRQFSH